MAWKVFNTLLAMKTFRVKWTLIFVQGQNLLAAQQKIFIRQEIFGWLKTKTSKIISLNGCK